MTYQEWEEQQRLSPVSPEAYYAEKAWNAALASVNYVLQPWLGQIPIKMQSTLVLGIRGFDGRQTVAVKKICKWLRGITFKPGRIDNLHQFMGGKPPRIVEKDPAYNDLDYVSRHYYSHLMHALEVVGYKHPDREVREHAHGLYQDMCHVWHLPIERMADFEARLKDAVWPQGQPNDYAEACAQLQDSAAYGFGEDVKR